MSTKDCIRNARILLGVSQRELGRILGFHHSVISQWELGKHLPQIHNIKRVVDKLKEFKIEYQYSDFED